MKRSTIPARRTARRTQLSRWLGRGLETHISLPLFALLLVLAMWVLTLRFIESERAGAINAAQTATRERLDTYEAQMARSLNGIDQTLKVLKYAVELKGARKAPCRRCASRACCRRDWCSWWRCRTAAAASSPAIPNPRRSTSRAPPISSTTAITTTAKCSSARPWATPPSASRTCTFSRRINDADGKFDGIAIVEADPAYFTSAYEPSRDGEQGLLGLAGTDGLMRAMRIGENVTGASASNWATPPAAPSPCTPAHRTAWRATPRCSASTASRWRSSLASAATSRWRPSRKRAVPG
ncbi:cache domain-containing protein [Massilia sp. Se16.2.3]|uniref:cache domain-containing protein n=1 Tax=Massilia sp. Se16.2.3 TaxID=2709303 RepID=UPI00186264C0|nr:cache domain-containing protein [Massilia sp. Se16.2.3]QNA99478.1 hypothetical protein G4G31_12590 [Massilia sp. Se16.2.3]